MLLPSPGPPIRHRPASECAPCPGPLCAVPRALLTPGCSNRFAALVRQGSRNVGVLGRSPSSSQALPTTRPTNSSGDHATLPGAGQCQCLRMQKSGQSSGSVQRAPPSASPAPLAITGGARARAPAASWRARLGHTRRLLPLRRPREWQSEPAARRNVAEPVALGNRHHVPQQDPPKEAAALLAATFRAIFPLGRTWTFARCAADQL